MNFRKIIGRAGEDQAVEFLKNKGLEILACNFSTREGEVDIVARDNETIIFVEVKTRNSNKFGSAIESVTDQKLEKIVIAGERWLIENNLENSDWRIDVIAIQNKKIEWIKGV